MVSSDLAKFEIHLNYKKNQVPMQANGCTILPGGIYNGLFEESERKMRKWSIKDELTVLKKVDTSPGYLVSIL